MQASIPTLVETTVIDGDETFLVPVGFDVAPTPDKSTKKGTLGLTRVGWPGLSGGGNVVVSYDRLSDAQADLLLMLCADRPDGRARIIQFSTRPLEPKYSARRLKVTLSDGSVPGTWAARLELNGNVVPI